MQRNLSIISTLLARENSFKTYSSQVFQVAQTTSQAREDAWREILTRSFQISRMKDSGS